MPVLVFNSGRYDLNFIKEHFVEQMVRAEGNIKVAKIANKIMYLLIPNFRFLDINYLRPGTSYEKWIKAYGCTAEKSWYPYKWFDSRAKLDFPGVPDYPTWYSRLRERFVLSRSKWKQCKRLFQVEGMHLRRLAAQLQQSGRGPWPGSVAKQCEPSTRRKRSTF